MPQDDNTTSSDPRASRSARRSEIEQDAKRRAAAGSSGRAARPGAMSSSIKSTEADIESRNNARSSHRDRDGHSPRRHREHRDRHHHSRSNDRDDDRHRRTRSGSHDRDGDRHRRTRSGSHDRTEDRDREAKRRARHGRSTQVGATSVSGNTRDSSNRKRREDEDRRSKQRARRNDSSSGATAPGAMSSTAPSRESREDARERKLRAAGLGMDDSNNNKAEPNRKDDFEKDPNKKGGHPDLGHSAAAAAPEAAMVDGDGAVHLQAELVDPNEEQKSMQAKMKEENERIQREMTAENERMRQQMQQDQDRLRREMQENNEQAEAEAKKKKQQRMICIIVVVLVAIAAGVGAFLGTRGGSSSSSPAAVNPPSTNPPTPATTTTEAPVAPQVTTAPTETPPLYEAPSDEDCAAIANADPVDAEDVTEVVGFDTTLDMTLSSSIDPEEALPLLQEQLQKRTMTSMAGCTKEQIQAVERRRLRLTNRRQLQQNKYVVLYAEVSSMEILEGESCQDESIPNCSKVLATMDMYLQGEEQRFRLVSRLVEILTGKDDEDFDLARALKLPNAISSLQLDSVATNDPTLEPTVAPTKVPTTPAPTGAQTTPAPVPAPTPNPTPNPTPQPTTRPPRPTPGPTEEEEEEECTNFCLGEEACDGFDLEFFTVGCGSCNDKRSCTDAQAFIGEESCLQGGCQNLIGEVGDRSCDGKGACGDLVEVTIGNDSCRCDGCCRCIQDGDIIPNGSCNVIAETRDDIEYVPYETYDRVEACCMEPGGGDGGTDGEGEGEDEGEGEGEGDEGLNPPPNGGGGGGGGGGSPPRPPN